MFFASNLKPNASNSAGRAPSALSRETYNPMHVPKSPKSRPTLLISLAIATGLLSIGSWPRAEVLDKSVIKETVAVKEQAKPQWWDNKLGTGPIVLPGYSPLKAVDTRVELYERVYSWHRSYFPENIISRGKILAKGMRLVARVDGKEIELVPNKVQIDQYSDVSAEILASGEPIPGLKLEVKTRVEYDGVAFSRIRLMVSEPIKLDGLDYEVYLPDSPEMEVLVFKASSIRRQKDRQDFVNLPYLGEFLNVIGFADGNRSFWWFADNAKGWIWNGQTVTEIVRIDGRIKLIQRLIGDLWKIDKPMEFNVNFLATPVRDIGSEWRSKRVITGIPNKQQAALGGAYKLWWTNAFAHDAFPYSYYQPEIQAKITKKERLIYPGREQNARIVWKDKVRYGIHWIPYFSAHVLSGLDPELARFRSHWEIHPPKVFREVVKPYRRIYSKPVLTHQAQSYSNYLLFRLNKEIDHLGIEGIYLDHGPPHDSNNPHNGGWVDSNGRLQPSLDILGLRDFIKRLRMLFHLHGKAGYIFIHNSNREIVPAYTFAYATVDGEQYRSGRVKQGDFLRTVSINEFRTRFSPGQYGVLVVWLPVEWTVHNNDPQWQGSEQQRIAYRRLMALALLHDVADWPKGAHVEEQFNLINVLDGFGIDKADFIGYWDQHIVTADNSGIKVSVYHRRDDGSYLLIVANITEKPQTTTLTFDLNQLGLIPASTKLISEGLGRSEFTFQDFFMLPVPARDFRLVELRQN